MGDEYVASKRGQKQSLSDRDAEWRYYENLLEAIPNPARRVLSARSALRCTPVAVLPTGPWESTTVRLIVLNTYRAAFVSWATRKYPADASVEAAQAAMFAASSAVGGNTRFTGGSAAHNADPAAIRFANRCVSESALYGIENALSTLHLMTEVVRSSSSISSTSVAWKAAYSIGVSDAEYASRCKDAIAVLSRPLWADAEGMRDIVLSHVESLRAMPDFAVDAGKPHWNLWLAWWENLQADPSRSLFGEEKDIELAMQDGTFWGDDDDNPDPDEIMQRVADLVDWPFEQIDEDEALAQVPARYTFAERNDRIVAVPFDAPAIDEGIVAELHQDLLEKFSELRERIERTQAPKRISDTITRLLDALGDTPAELKPGTLLSRQRSLEADVVTYRQEEVLKEVDPEVVSMMLDAAASLEDLIGAHPKLSEIKASALANSLQSDQVDAAIEPIAEIIAIAEQSPVVDASAVEALTEADADIRSLSDAIADARNGDLRAKAIELRAKEMADQLLVVRNFAALVVKSARETLNDAAKNELYHIRRVSDGDIDATRMLAFRFGFFLPLASLVGPISAIALFVSPYKVIGATINKVLPKLPNDDPIDTDSDDSGR
ncbi:MAG: hypothetical protein OXR62_07825 [Ahrensia sp.]|nr:hypothetical protein [Ahrensia sp.]